MSELSPEALEQLAEELWRSGAKECPAWGDITEAHRETYRRYAARLAPTVASIVTAAVEAERARIRDAVEAVLDWLAENGLGQQEVKFVRQNLRAALASTAPANDRCPMPWCAYSMPHEHTQTTASARPSFDDLLNDPTQQLDTDGEVLAMVLCQQAQLTVAEREMCDRAALYGHLRETVEELIRDRLRLASAAPALDAVKAEARCECPPCPGRGNDGHGLTHCAECCIGSGVEAGIDCPVHGERADRIARGSRTTDDPRPCRGQNSNVCVAEGCYGEACRGAR